MRGIDEWVIGFARADAATDSDLDSSVLFALMIVAYDRDFSIFEVLVVATATVA